MELLKIQTIMIICWYSILKELLGNIKLTNRYRNKEIAKFLYYQCKLNAEYYSDYIIRWIPFIEFKNIEYLAKGGFGEVHKATWIRYGCYNYYRKRYEDKDVVLKRIYN